jgi:uncharacterized protein (TIGR03083 family)
MQIDVYRASHARTSEIAVSLTDEQLETVVPAAPKWTVRDLLGHIVGVAGDVSAWPAAEPPTIPPSDDYTAGQVQRRREQSMSELMDDWARAVPIFAERMAGWGRWNAPIHDMVCHEADIRGALKLPRLPDEAWQASLDDWPSFLTECGPMLSWEWGLLKERDAIAVRAGDRTYTLGDGEPSATVEAPNGYELWRALFGGRSKSQIADWRWSTDPEPYLDTLPFFPAMAEDVTEA